MVFKQMDPKKIQELLKGQKDIVTPAFKEHEKYFQNLTCINCGSAVYPYIDSRTGLFKPNSVIPNYIAKCTKCSCQFEPYTKIQLTIPR